MTKRWKYITIIACAEFFLLLGFAAVILVPALVPMTEHYAHGDYYCTRCGRYMYADEVRLGDRRSPPTFANAVFEETPLSKWHKEHFGDTCSHLWKLDHGGGSDSGALWGLIGRSKQWTMSGHRSPLCSLPYEDRRVLEDIYARDKETCRLYIELQLLDYNDRAMEIPDREDIKLMLQTLKHRRGDPMKMEPPSEPQ